MLTRLECSKLFLTMETELSDKLNSFKYHDDNIWQYIRLLYNLTFMEGTKERYPHLISNKLNFYEKNIFALPKGYYKIISRFRKESVLFWTEYGSHNQLIDGKKYNPYLDYFLHLARQQGFPVLKIVHGFTGMPESLLMPGFGIVIYTYNFYNEFIDMDQCDFYNDYRRLSIISKTPCLELRKILYYYYAIESFFSIFKNLLGILRPIVVLLENYYEIKAVALIKACQSLGIPCVDVQHGLQNWPHLAYNFPIIRDKWETLPEYFFTWGKMAADNLAKSLDQQNFHKVYISGKPDYFAWRNKTIQVEPDKVNELKKIIGNRFAITLALPVKLKKSEDALELVKRAIELSPDNWVWLIRQHPCYYDDSIKVLENYGDKVETVYSSQLLTFDVLQLSRHLVTGESTLAIEALHLFHYRATTLFSTSTLFYSEYHRNNLIGYATTTEELIADINYGINSSKVTSDIDDYYSKDYNAFCNSIKHVLAKKNESL